MLSQAALKKRIEHLQYKIEERNLDLDIEYLVYLTDKSQIRDGAIVFGKFIDELRGLCKIVMIVRDGFPATVFPRQIEGNFSKSALEVEQVVYL
jgi:hypothetical protein